VPPPTTTDNSKLVDTQLKKPLVPNNRKNGDDLLNLSQKKNKVDPQDPTGIVPAPTTTDNSKLVDTQLKKPLIPENRKNGDDLLNLNQNKNIKKVEKKIDPTNPTDLVPPPTTTDNSKFVDSHLKKPLILENRKDIGKSNDDLLIA